MMLPPWQRMLSMAIGKGASIRQHYISFSIIFH